MSKDALEEFEQGVEAFKAEKRAEREGVVNTSNRKGDNMSGMAIAIINGNLTADPELRNTKNGKRVCGFSVAVNDVWTDQDGEKQEDVSFFDIAVFGKMAETVAAHKRKGDEVTVQGRLKQSRWENDGSKRSKIEVVADQVVFNGSKRSES